MSQQTINTGARTNDNTGDTMRAAFDKVNDNFIELYAGGGDGLSVVDGYSSTVMTPFTATHRANGTPVASDYIYFDDNVQPTPMTPRQPARVSDNGSFRYRFQIATDSAFNTIIHDDRLVSGDVTMMPNLTLAFSTTYYLRVLGNTNLVRSFTFPLTVRTPVRGSTTNVGNDPRAIAWAPSSDRIYIANRSGNSITVVRPDTGAVVTTLATSLNPRSICYSPSNDRIYHTAEGATVVRVINPNTNTLVGSITVGSTPRGICYCPSNDRLYVANQGANSVSVINPATDTVLTTISATSVSNDIIYCPTTDRIIYASGGSVLREIDPTTNTVVTTSSGLGANVEGRMTYCPINNRLYCGGPSGGTGLIVYNPVTHALAATITMGSTAIEGTAYCPTTNRIYVSPSNGSQVQLVNPLTGSIVANVTGFSSPKALCYVPSTDNVWASDDTAGTDTVSPIS